MQPSIFWIEPHKHTHRRKHVLTANTDKMHKKDSIAKQNKHWKYLRLLTVSFKMYNQFGNKRKCTPTATNTHRQMNGWIDEEKVTDILPAVSRGRGKLAGQPFHIPDHELSAVGLSDPPQPASSYCSAGEKRHKHTMTDRLLEEDTSLITHHHMPVSSRLTQGWRFQ